MKAGFGEILPGMVAAAVLGLVLLMLIFLFEFSRWHWQAFRARTSAEHLEKRGVDENRDDPLSDVETAPDLESAVEAGDEQNEDFPPVIAPESDDRHIAPISREEMDEDNGNAETVIENHIEYESVDFAPVSQIEVVPREEITGHDREARQRRRGERSTEGARKNRKRDPVHAEESSNNEHKRASRLARKERRNVPAAAGEDDARERRRNKRQA